MSGKKKEKKVEKITLDLDDQGRELLGYREALLATLEKMETSGTSPARVDNKVREAVGLLTTEIWENSRGRYK